MSEHERSMGILQQADEERARRKDNPEGWAVCQKCNERGGRVVTFKRGSLLESRWVCPHCIEATEAKLARITAAVESYRGTYLVSKSGTHLGDPANEILAAAAKGDK